MKRYVTLSIFIIFIFLLIVTTYAQEPDTLWTKTYGSSGDDIGRSVIETTNGEFIIAGHTDSFGAGMKDGILIKTNLSGDTIWTKTYGGGND